MLELIAPSPITLQPLSHSFTRTLTGLTTLAFTLSPRDPALPQLREESLIRDTATGQTYRLRGIHILPSEAEFSARLQLDDWEASAVTRFVRTSATAQEILGEILPKNWSLRCLQTSDVTRDFTMEFGGTPLDIVEKVQELYSCAIAYDNLQQVCILSFPECLPVSDTVLTEGADLRSIPEYTGKSTSLCTRIYPVGADNVTIESVNHGLPYVENHSYTDRVIAKIWKDERYTIPAHLKAAAQEMVDSLCQPETAWEISIHDLYRRDPERWAGHKAVLGQRIKVTWQGREITAMIVEETVYPDDPGKNTLCIGSVPATAIGSLGQLKRRLEDPNGDFSTGISATIRANLNKITPDSIGAVSKSGFRDQLSGYATESYISSSLTGYATENFVTSQIQSAIDATWEASY